MPYRTIVPGETEGRASYFLLTSLVVPRPIAWVSSVAEDGKRNLAPHSFFNAISSDPPIVHFTSTGVKDTLRNVRATGEFVVNIVTEDFADRMNVTAANLPPDRDEFLWARLESEPSLKVEPERVAGIKAALECKVEQIVSLGNGNMVFGDVVCLHVDESVMDGDRILQDRLGAIARLGGAGYTRVADGLFEMKRPTYEDLLAAGKEPASDR